MRAKILAGLCFALLFAAPAQASKLYISEYNSLVVTSGVNAQIAPEPGLDQAPVDFSGGEAKSALFANPTSYVRVICDAQCSIKVNTTAILAGSPATNANKVLPALTPEYFGVTPGGTLKISVIANP